MPDSTSYRVPAARHRVEQTIERSRFVCTIERAPTAELAQGFVKAMNLEFADATHNCWAFVAGAPGDAGRIGMSDDGEPHGTAGRPMLTVLLHSAIGEIVAVVTRYYGGIKLGTGGLVKAYGGTVQLAVASLPLGQFVDFVGVSMTFGYSAVAAIQQLLLTLGVEIVEERYEVKVEYLLRVPRSQLTAFRAAVADATRGAGVVELRDG